MNTIYTLGVEQDPSARLLCSLMADERTLCMDCRLNPWSWRSAWQKRTLESRFGKRYHFAGAFLGNRKHPSNRMLPGACEIELVDPCRGIATLARYLDDHDLVLIDHYLEFKYSHLVEILKLLQGRLPDVEVVSMPRIEREPQSDLLLQRYAALLAEVRRLEIEALEAGLLYFRDVHGRVELAEISQEQQAMFLAVLHDEDACASLSPDDMEQFEDHTWDEVWSRMRFIVPERGDVSDAS